MNKQICNWKKSIIDQINFYNKGFPKKREDNDFDWGWWKKALGLKGLLRESMPILFLLFKKIVNKHDSNPYSTQWVEINSELLWNTRVQLKDGISKMQFDFYLVLRGVGSSRFYFPRTELSDFIEINTQDNFISGGLPREYGSLPIKLLNVTVNNCDSSQQFSLNLISPLLGIQLENNFRQYFISRENVSFFPKKGDVVFDCGACVGEISTIIAGLVGEKGEVHTFDPIPLHSKFIKHHSEINSRITHVFKINEFAVDSESKANDNGALTDVDSISPGGLVINKFNSISLDDYADQNNLARLDYIKMDIEGYEINALKGAKIVISKFKPRLAICVYHKPTDLWEILSLIKSYNQDYSFYFGHHSPVEYEAVLYAC